MPTPYHQGRKQAYSLRTLSEELQGLLSESREFRAPKFTFRIHDEEKNLE